MKMRLFLAFGLMLSLAFLGSAEEQKAMSHKMTGKTMSKAEKIKNAMSSAPMPIAKDATIVELPQMEGGEMTTLREGTNGWTCVPDDPHTPANDPMCMDKGGMEWGMAWMSHKEPNLTTSGLGYMLQGGGSPSNTDPFAMEPKAGEKWLKEPPHIMLFPAGGKLDQDSYGTDPNSGQPWIMFPGTPYQHLMIPVR